MVYWLMRLLGVTVLVGGLLALGWLRGEPASAEPGNPFDGITAHIRSQIQVDKVQFARANTCTEWFYRHEYNKSPSRPESQGVAWRPTAGQALRLAERLDCRAAYPEGLKAAREDFSRQQSFLTVSLTFYEFVLVADRNDDARYSRTEWHDLLNALGLRGDLPQSQTQQVSAVTGQFDTFRSSSNLEALMAGMSALFDKGYRLSPADKTALDRVTQ